MNVSAQLVTIIYKGYKGALLQLLMALQLRSFTLLRDIFSALVLTLQHPCPPRSHPRSALQPGGGNLRCMCACMLLGTVHLGIAAIFLSSLQVPQEVFPCSLFQHAASQPAPSLFMLASVPPTATFTHYRCAATSMARRRVNGLTAVSSRARTPTVRVA